MDYPKIRINLRIIKNNVKTITSLCNSKGINVAGVTKVFCGHPEIAKTFIEGGVFCLADSRIENLVKLKDFDIPKIMLRLPMKSEVEKVVDYSDVSLNSELDTVIALSEAAIKKGKVHKIVLMVDLGDLREGYFSKETLFDAIDEIVELKGVKIIGLGTNLTCYGGVIPTKEILGRLTCIGNEIESKHNIKLHILSGGNSSTVHLLEDNETIGTNNLRLGESLVIGVETAYGKQIKGTGNDAFILHAEIIEAKEKPSVPTGKTGMDAFGNKPSYVDRGVRKRIICAVGRQDIDLESMYPLDKNIIIIGASSDHLILDCSDGDVDYKVGDIIEFRLSYAGILRGMTSEYITKEFIR
ncbi:MAG: alanine/ornithine racemase family PLP-dependent enzyme [Tissierella sp.]|nr:alanine/ornithine racemase family PLP-dependent enzyme [Tissierella sp.]